ncbi:MAG: hypothetical protein EA424_05665 [Planctomycetaceae bacterium]|nr:MAG: hypothetical protein EA424_05665 [Planctomycetaceae bacterium]
MNFLVFNEVDVNDEFGRVFTLVALAGGMGLGAYCIACALHVWGARNARLTGQRRRWLIWCGWTTLAIGLLITLAAVVVQLILHREGVLRANDLYTVRASREWYVASVTEDEWVSEGMPLLKFHSPEREADLQSLRLKLDDLLLQQERLDCKPLELDNELIRELTDALGERRHHQANQHDLEMEKSRVLRELARDELGRRDSLLQLQEQIRSLHTELKQAEFEKELQQRRLARAAALENRSAISQEEHDEISSEAQIAVEEVARRKNRLEELVAARDELERLLQTLVLVMHDQSKTFGMRLEMLDQQLATLQSRRTAMEEQLEADRIRATRYHEAQRKQLEVEVRQTEAARDALEQSLCITAPYAGRIIYRNTSPNTVKPGDALIVLAQKDGVRARLRLPSWEARVLDRQDRVVLQLVEPKSEVGDVKQRYVQRRFTGSPLSIQPLPEDPGFALVELSCDLPPDGMRTLASGDEIEARLIWVAPFYFNPTIRFSAFLMLCGGVGIAVAVLRRAPETTSDPKIVASQHPLLQPSLHAAGGDGAMLHLLGSQLRESVLSMKLDSSLVAAAEWAIDRHRARAIRVIQHAVGDPAALVDRLESYSDQFMNGGDDLSDDQYCIQAELLQRTVAIFAAVLPENSVGRIKRLQQKLDDGLFLSVI